ncbi:MAG: metallophosphoesterase [Planctomycetota bacterium]
MTDQRRIFIGDVQGCLEPLERLLRKLRFDPERDRLHLTGDLVNRGPDSLGVLRLARSLDLVAVLGNHDAHLLDVARGRVPMMKSATFVDVLRAPDREELLALLEGLPAMIHLGDLVLVHAAIRPDWGPLDEVAPLLNERLAAAHRDGHSAFADEDLYFALSARYCTKGGCLPKKDWPAPERPFRNWVEFLKKRETIVFGHHARKGLQQGPGYRGLDTGCVYGGRLTAWIAEEDCFVSVPLRAK